MAECAKDSQSTWRVKELVRGRERERWRDEEGIRADREIDRCLWGKRRQTSALSLSSFFFFLFFVSISIERKLWTINRKQLLLDRINLFHRYRTATSARVKDARRNICLLTTDCFSMYFQQIVDKSEVLLSTNNAEPINNRCDRRKSRARTQIGRLNMWQRSSRLGNSCISFLDEYIIQHSIRWERQSRRIEYLDSIIINQHVRWQSNAFADYFLLNPEVDARIITPLPRLSSETTRHFYLSIFIYLKCRWDLAPDVCS